MQVILTACAVVLVAVFFILFFLKRRNRDVIELVQMFDTRYEGMIYMNSVYNLFAKCDRLKLVSVRNPYSSLGVAVVVKYRSVDGFTKIIADGRGGVKLAERTQGRTVEIV